MSSHVASTSMLVLSASPFRFILWNSAHSSVTLRLGPASNERHKTTHCNCLLLGPDSVDNVLPRFRALPLCHTLLLFVGSLCVMSVLFLPVASSVLSNMFLFSCSISGSGSCWLPVHGCVPLSSPRIRPHESFRVCSIAWHKPWCTPCLGEQCRDVQTLSALFLLDRGSTLFTCFFFVCGSTWQQEQKTANEHTTIGEGRAEATTTATTRSARDEWNARRNVWHAPRPRWPAWECSRCGTCSFLRSETHRNMPEKLGTQCTTGTWTRTASSGRMRRKRTGDRQEHGTNARKRRRRTEALWKKHKLHNRRRKERKWRRRSSNI